MGHRTGKFLIILMITAVLLLVFGCDLGLIEGNTGSLAISLGSSSRNLVWEPELDMDVASYTITGTGPTADDVFTVSGHTEGLFTKDGLALGNWTITVDGYNGNGTKIATIQAAATVTRNATTPVTVVLRPLEGTGTLSVSMSWTDSHGVLASPSAVVVIRDEQGSDIQTISEPVALTVSGQTAAAEVTNLLTGWYEVTVSLKDGNSTAWQGVFALRVVKDQTTTGTVVIDGAQIQIGSGAGTVAITIQEDMDDPLSVGFSGMPDSVEAGIEMILTSTVTYSGDVQYRWYVNGVRQADQTESSFSYTFDTAGTHTVSLLVLDGGALGGYGESITVTKGTASPITREELMAMIANGEDITQVNTSQITDMSYLFRNNTTFDQDISGWDVSNATNMKGMFWGASSFDQDISGWDVSNVTNMSYMFNNASSFNQDISDWDVSSVTDMSWMFVAVSFNPDVSSWDVSNVTNMLSMFNSAKSFNQDISSWDVSSVTNMAGLFYGAKSFNQDISSWDVSNVAGMSSMFRATSLFNGDLSGWDVGNVTDMDSMFYESSFNQDISDWDVSCVTNMANMFAGTSSFNQDISSWDVSSVTDMSWMFSRALSFNGDLSDWDVSDVRDMSNMFYYAKSFNQDISGWDVSNVMDTGNMFSGASLFNQDISDWNVSSVIKMNSMFSLASSFNQDLSDWDVSSVTNMNSMFYGARLFNQDISGWDVSNVTNMGSMFCAISFNQDISGWDVSSVTNMNSMFYGAKSFNQDLSTWDVDNVTNHGDFAGWDCPLSTDHQPKWKQ